MGGGWITTLLVTIGCLQTPVHCQPPSPTRRDISVQEMLLAYSDGPIQVDSFVQSLSPYLSGATIDTQDITRAPLDLQFWSTKKSILVWSNVPMTDPIGVGDSFAEFVRQGGCVVEAVAFFEASNIGVGGLWKSQSVGPFVSGTVVSVPGTISMGAVLNPSHRIFVNVSTISGTKVNRIEPATAGPDSTTLAEWNDGTPFIVERPYPNKGRVIGMNLYPLDFPQYSTDTIQLIANTMKWCIESSDAPSQLVFIIQPPFKVKSDELFKVTVELQDENGVPKPFDGQVITMSFNKDPTNIATLSGVPSLTTNGEKTKYEFELSVDKVGVGYQLRASITGGPSFATSRPFEVTAGNSTVIVITSSPSAPVRTGQPFVVAAEIRDSKGNPSTIPTLKSVTIFIYSDPNIGVATLSGNTRVTSDGLTSEFVFSQLTLDKMGNDYRLGVSISDASLPTAITAPFDVIAGTPFKVVFVRQPPDIVVAGATFDVTVAIQDEQGNSIGVLGNLQVSLDPGTNPNSARLSGLNCCNQTTTTAKADYVWQALAVDTAGRDYALTAVLTPQGLGAISEKFTVIGGRTTKVVIIQQPPIQVTAGNVFPLIIGLRDGFGNPTTSPSTPIRLSLAGGPSVATLEGSIQHSMGYDETDVIFDDLVIRKAGIGYIIDVELRSCCSTRTIPFTVVAGIPTQLLFSIEPPVTVLASNRFTTEVQFQDEHGNAANPSTTLIVANTPNSNQLVLAVYPCLRDCSLTGSTVVPLDAGRSTYRFVDLSINRIGEYRLNASSGNLNATSRLFSVMAGPPSQLVITEEPPAVVTAAQKFEIRVEIQDDAGNPSPPAAGKQISLKLENDPTGGVAQLSGTMLGQTTEDEAVYYFHHLYIDKIGNGYTVSALLYPEGWSDVSVPFRVQPGEPSALRFKRNPLTAHIARANITVIVECVDGGKNLVPLPNPNLRLSLFVSPNANETAHGVTTYTSRATDEHEWTFSQWSIHKAGIGYIVMVENLVTPASSQYQAGTLSQAPVHYVVIPAYSTPFDAVFGSPAQISFVQGPNVDVRVQAPFEVKIAVQDKYGNILTNYTNNNGNGFLTLELYQLIQNNLTVPIAAATGSTSTRLLPIDGSNGSTSSSSTPPGAGPSASNSGIVVGRSSSNRATFVNVDNLLLGTKQQLVTEYIHVYNFSGLQINVIGNDYMLICTYQIPSVKWEIQSPQFNVKVINHNPDWLNPPFPPLTTVKESSETVLYIIVGVALLLIFGFALLGLVIRYHRLQSPEKTGLSGALQNKQNANTQPHNNSSNTINNTTNNTTTPILPTSTIDHNTMQMSTPHQQQQYANPYDNPLQYGYNMQGYAMYDNNNHNNEHMFSADTMQATPGKAYYDTVHTHNLSASLQQQPNPSRQQVQDFNNYSHYNEPQNQSGIRFDSPLVPPTTNPLPLPSHTTLR